MTVTKTQRSRAGKASTSKLEPKPKVRARKSALKPANPARDGFGVGATARFSLDKVLESAGRVRRLPTPEGREALLTEAERTRVATLFAQLKPQTSKALQALIQSVPEGAAQALMLKAIG